jgi:hypothetical protein
LRYAVQRLKKVKHPPLNATAARDFGTGRQNLQTGSGKVVIGG